MTEPRQAEPTTPRGADRAPEGDTSAEEPVGQPICPICGGTLIEIRAKLQCERCHTILETCCEGGRQ